MFFKLNGLFMEREWDMVSELHHQGDKVTIQTARGETLANGWLEFYIKSHDNVFTNIFVENEIRIAIKPSLPYSPENDLDYEKRTPEQTILIKEISDIIRQRYF